MAQIESYRLINVSYNNKEKYIPDLTIDMDGKHAIIIIPNGCGKTYTLSLLFQTVLPGRLEVEGRSFDELFKDLEGTSHIAVCYKISEKTRIVAGFTVQKADTVSYYNWLISLPEDSDIRKIKLTEDNMVVEYNIFKDYLKKNEEIFKSKIFEETSKSKYKQTLYSYGIFADEWEMMFKANKTEGGIEKLIGTGEKRTYTDMVSKFIVPLMTNEIYKDEKNSENLPKTFFNQVKNIRNIPYWKNSLKKAEEILMIFEKQLERLKKINDSKEAIKDCMYTINLIKNNIEKQKNENEQLIDNLIAEIKETEETLKTLSENRKINRAGFLKYQEIITREKIKDIQKNKEELLTQKEELRKNIKIHLIYPVYQNYMISKGELESIERLINTAIEKSFDFQERLNELSSKIYDYYLIQIVKNEEEIKNVIYEMHEIKSEIEKNGKIRFEKEHYINKLTEDKNKILNIIDKMNEILDNKNFDEVNTDNENMTKIKETAERNYVKLQREIQELKIRKKNIDKDIEYSSPELVKVSDEYEIFKKEKSYINDIKILLNSENIHSAEKKLNLFIEDTRDKISSLKIETEKHGQISEFIEKTNKLPPVKDIQELNRYLIRQGYQKVLSGSEYASFTGIYNEILPYSIVIDEKDRNRLLKNLEGFTENSGIVFILNREEADKKIVNLLKNEYIKVFTGEIALTDYYQNIQLRMKNFIAEKESLLLEQKEKEEFLFKIKNYISRYGYDEINEEVFENQLKTIETKIEKMKKELDEIESAINNTRIEINLAEGEISGLKYQISLMEEKIKKAEMLISILEENYSIEEKGDINSKVKEIEFEAENQIILLDEICKKEEELNKNYYYLDKKNIDLNSSKKLLEDKIKSYTQGIYKYEDENIYSLNDEFNKLKNELKIDSLYISKEKTQKHIGLYLDQINNSEISLHILESTDILKLEPQNILNKKLEEIETVISSTDNKLGAFENECIQYLKEIKTFGYNYDNLRETNKEEFEKISEELVFLYNENEENKRNYLEKKEEITAENIINKSLLKTMEDYLKEHKEIETDEKRIIKDPSVFSENPEIIFDKIKIQNNQLKLIKSQMEKEMENEWWNLRNILGDEIRDITLGVLGLINSGEKIPAVDYETIKSFFDKDSEVLKLKIEALNRALENAVKDRELLINNAYEDIMIYARELNKISENSKIRIDERYIKTIKFNFQEKEINEKEIKTKIERYLEEIIDKIEDIEDDELEAYIKMKFTIYELLKVSFEEGLRLNIYKPSLNSSKPFYELWDNVKKWSGGERYFAFFCVYIALILWIRNNRTGTKTGTMTVLLDNPFATASSEHILSPLLKLMDDNNVQFIAFTHLKDESITRYFSYKYSLTFDKILNKEYMTIEKGYFKSEEEY